MSEQKKNTGLFHDDHGNVDDRRIVSWSGWALIVYLVVRAARVTPEQAEPVIELVRILIWPTLVLMGVTVTEKLSGGGS